MKKISIVFLLAVIAFVSAVTLRASETPVFIRGIRPLGMGGAFVAIADDQNAVFYNPSGLTQRQGSQLTLFELPINISEDVLNFYNYFNDNQNKLKNFDSQTNSSKIDLLNEINDRIVTYRPQVRLGFPNTSYLTGSGFLSWGFGVYSQAAIGFQFNRSLIIPSISFWGNADVALAAPLSHRFDRLPYIPGKLAVGTTLKYITRGRVSEMNKSVLEFENFSPAFQLGRGIGADLGAMYQPTDRWNVGLQVTDVGGTKLLFDEVKATKAGEVDKLAFTGVIEPQTNVGFAFIPSKIYYWPGKYIGTQNRLIFACDVRDITNSDEALLDATFWKKLHMGAELRWGPLSLRGGFSSGYPAFGFGFRIPYLGLKADYAYWGDEMGRYAGQIPSFNHQISLSLSWGDSKGRAYGSDAAKIDAAVLKKDVAKKEAVKKEAEVAVSSSTATVPVPAAAITGQQTAIDTKTPSAGVVPASAVVGQIPEVKPDKIEIKNR